MSTEPDNFHRANREGMTLVEVSAAIAMIGAILMLAIPAFIKTRKQSEGRRITNDAREMDAAIDQWATEVGQAEGEAVQYDRRRRLSVQHLDDNRPAGQ
jgi:prepilin-type N-terminal cleavage/methylation domain-containing protein